MKEAHNCSICSAQFDRASRLEAHERTHTGERPFTCECGKSYFRAQHLKRHQLSSCSQSPSTTDRTADEITRDKKTYTCIQCNAGPFRQKKMVWAHIAMVHRERKHACDQCSRSFPTKSKLARHTTKHHGFICSACIPVDLDASESPVDPSTWRFENFIALRRHLATVHPKPSLQCPNCGQRFNRPKALSEHELTHTPGGPQVRRQFVCPLCPRPEPGSEAEDTATQSQPDKSVPVAEGCEQPVATNRLVAFTAKRNLHAHMRAVHANHVFPCTWSGCPVLLSTKQKLVQHLERHKTGRPVASQTRGPRKRHISKSSEKPTRRAGPKAEDGSSLSSGSASESSVMALLMQSDEDGGGEHSVKS